MFLVNVIKAITPSCLVLTFCPLSTVELWLLLSSSVSKLNNHEEKNITCRKFTPFSFASYYPNSSLILYHYYPPTNDRVEAIVPLNALLCQKTKHNKKPICNSFSVSCPGCCVALFSPLRGVTHSREAGWNVSPPLNGNYSGGTKEVRAKLWGVWWECSLGPTIHKGVLCFPSDAIHASQPPLTWTKNVHLRQIGWDGGWTGAKS